MQNRKNIHWPWAPVIIGSGLILLSILMRMYGFQSSFTNLVSSAGDIVVIFSLLYIIKVFLIDEAPIPSPVFTPGYGQIMPEFEPAPAAVISQPTPSYAPSRLQGSYSIQRSAQLPSFWNELRFRVVAVDERTASVTVQADIEASEMPLPAQRSALELMKHQGEVKSFIQGWAESQHGAGFAVADIQNLSIEQTGDGGLRIVSSYTLNNPTV